MKTLALACILATVAPSACSSLLEPADAPEHTASLDVTGAEGLAARFVGLFDTAAQVAARPDFPHRELVGCRADVPGMDHAVILDEFGEEEGAVTNRLFEFVDAPEGKVRIVMHDLVDPVPAACRQAAVDGGSVAWSPDRLKAMPGCAVLMAEHDEVWLGISEGIDTCHSLFAWTEWNDTVITLWQERIELWDRGFDGGGARIAGTPGYVEYLPVDEGIGDDGSADPSDPGWSDVEHEEAVRLSCGELRSEDTATSPWRTWLYDAYECAVGNYEAPEIVFDFTPTFTGAAAFSLVDAVPTLVNHDVFVLTTEGDCLAWGSNSVEFAVDAGEPLLLVVDGYHLDAGPFVAELTCPL